MIHRMSHAVSARLADAVPARSAELYRIDCGVSVEASAADLCADLVKKLSSPVVGACKAFELPSSPRIAEQNMAERIGIELRDLLRQLYVYSRLVHSGS